MTTDTALELEKLLPATFTAPGLSEEEFLELCEKFPDAFLEYTADGTVVITPPTDPDSIDTTVVYAAIEINTAFQKFRRMSFSTLNYQVLLSLYFVKHSNA